MINTIFSESVTLNRRFLKLFSLLLVVVILLLNFSGCKKKDDNKVDIGYISGNY